MSIVYIITESPAYENPTPPTAVYEDLSQVEAVLAQRAAKNLLDIPDVWAADTESHEVWRKEFVIKINPRIEWRST